MFLDFFNFKTCLHIKVKKFNNIKKNTLLTGSSISKCSLHLRKSRHASKASVKAFTGITLELLSREEHLVAAEGVEGFLGEPDLRGVDTFRCVLDGVFGGSDESFWCNLPPWLPFSYLSVTHFKMLIAAVRR